MWCLSTSHQVRKASMFFFQPFRSRSGIWWSLLHSCHPYQVLRTVHPEWIIPHLWKSQLKRKWPEIFDRIIELQKYVLAKHSMKSFGNFIQELTALIPESCCANIIIKAMNNGDRSAPLVNISLNEICGMSFIFSCSALISSISEWTSTLPRSQFNALVARSSSSLSKSKNLGDSGQNGKVTTWCIQKNQYIQ